MDIWLRNQSQTELDSAFDSLADELIKAKESYGEIRELDEKLFGDDFEA